MRTDYNKVVHVVSSSGLGFLLIACGEAPSLPPTSPPGPPSTEQTPPATEEAIQPTDGPSSPSKLVCGHPKSFGCLLDVPGGTFSMGAQAGQTGQPGHDLDALPNEGPVHSVTVAPFQLMENEVSQVAWLTCHAEGACRLQNIAAAPQRPEGLSQQPIDAAVGGLTWQGAVEVCSWLGARLPTEAEWELAARGLASRTYPWGEDLACRVTRRSAARLTPEVISDECSGQKRIRGAWEKGPYGHLQMGGGMYEWVADWYGPYADGPVEAPTGPSSGEFKVQRGGAWTAISARDFRAAGRTPAKPAVGLIDAGVRCAGP